MVEELIGPQIPIDHPRYQIAELNAVNWSKWVRENTPQQNHKYKVGDVVVIVKVVEITKAYRDCDGTPLYQFDGDGGGHCEDMIIRNATEEEAMWTTVTNPVNFTPSE